MQQTAGLLATIADLEVEHRALDDSRVLTVLALTDYCCMSDLLLQGGGQAGAVRAQGCATAVSRCAILQEKVARREAVCYPPGHQAGSSDCPQDDIFMLARGVEHEKHLLRQIQADILARQVVLVLTGHQQAHR